ncbi:MAG: Bifunctional protein GlmU [Alphaproteobacteria bacterium MarineAlpha5_Bin9]|nr:MAG: Bifunctional protein GlmU [Alphaproteobacteria bacterium MarineAlpha5_Bin9]|tara:strand:+ start:10629 stop:11930 length:1302 start_codon:yes stop_codon:yes gene_type:complete
MSKIATIILAAGKSSRIKSAKSKIFHHLAERSLIEYVYEIGQKISNKNVFIVCNKNIHDELRNLLPEANLVIQKKQDGTAGAIFSAKSKVRNYKKILILFGDAPLIKISTINKLIKNYNNTRLSGSLLAFITNKPKGYGRIETANKYVKKITEEKEANNKIKKINLCNSGIMIVDNKFLFDNVKNIKYKTIKKEKSITDIFEIAYSKKLPFNYHMCSENELHGVNSRDQLINLDRILQDQLKSKLINNGVTILQPETVRVSYDTKIGRDSIIEPFVVIKKGVNIKSRVLIKSHSNLEGCEIDEKSIIGPSARIRPDTKIGKNVKIGNYVEVKNSKIDNSTSISHLSYIGDSYIGQKVNIGAGTITCNYDGKKKNKTIIKNNVFIGSNSSLIAPVIIEKNSTIGAGSIITKNVPSNNLAVSRANQKNLKKNKKY